MSRLLAATIAARGALTDGWIEIEGERILATGVGAAPRAPDARLAGVVAPGLCDLQVNGAGGFEVAAGGPGLAEIDRVQLAHGVTSYLPTLPSPDEATARRVLGELAERVDDPASPVAGVHVEGPFLNPRHAGMHPRRRLRSPADGVPEWLLAPPVTLVTLAPELPGGLALIERLRDAGIAVALGHSGADARTAAAAIEAGASLVTHVFNAMAPLLHRAPGLAGVALIDPSVRVAVIADGVHVDPVVLELVRRAAGERTVLVSDATPGAGAAAGDYSMAGVPIATRTERPGARTLDGRLAGSTITLDAAVATWASVTGATLAEALAAATESPARVIGGATELRAGASADFVVVGDDGRVREVFWRGARVRA